MTRTRDWTKLGFLVAVTILLAVGFAAAIDLPTSHAQERTAPTFSSGPHPVIPAAQPAADLGNAFAAVAEAVRPAVVFIRAESQATARRRSSVLDDFFNERTPDPQPRSGQGSGFIISTNGYIMTNNHVVADATRLSVTLFDGRVFDAEIVGRDPDTDIAVIKIDAEDVPSVTLGESDAVRVGEWVLAIGNPLGQEFSFTVTAGIVSGRGRRLLGLERREGPNYTIHDFIQTDAAINPGNSGGPLVNINGQVIGVNAAIASQTGLYTGYGFAVPINLAKRVSEQLIASGKVTRAVLGILIQNATPEDAEYVGLDSIYGVRIENFPDENSPARRAGLREGDIIIAVDGQPARYTAQLQQEIGFRTPGEEVDVTVARRGGQYTFKVQLQEARVEEQEPTTRTAAAPGRRNEALVNPKLGIAVRELTRAELAEEDMDSRLEGLQIERVDPDGPARGFLNRGEIITHVNGERVTNADDLNEVLNDVGYREIISIRTVGIDQRGQVLGRTVRMRTGSQ